VSLKYKPAGVVMSNIAIRERLKSMSDSDLVAAYRAGDQRAFGEIIRRYERPLFVVIRRLVKDQDLILEIIQDAFFGFHTHINRYDPSRKLFPWITKIAYNLAVDRIRTKSRSREWERRNVILYSDLRPNQKSATVSVDSAPSGSPLPDELCEQRDTIDKVAESMKSLLPSQRRAVTLRDIEGLTIREIAEVTGYTEGSISTFIHRGRRKLRAKLGQDFRNKP
jgi:RNA polymerase sigma factor (sigma-70 family)